MAAPEHVVIIGGGLAGAKTAESLREQGFTGAVSLVAGEKHLPYERPPLSKGYLAGEASFNEAAVVHQADWYHDHDIDLRLHTRAALVDAVAQIVCERHRDDVPCVLALPILDGTDDYLGWIRDETTGAPGGR